MNKQFRSVLFTMAVLLWAYSLQASGTRNFEDTTRSYSLPTLLALEKGQVGLSWTEADDHGVKYLYWATSSDAGQHFSKKLLVVKSAGLSSSRLMRPKVLAQKDGTLVAVYADNPVATAAHDEHSDHGGGRPSELQIMYVVSKDKGQTWTTPRTVHKDKTTGIIRGFFDATIMANDEVAVAYLKDNGNPHERDLRIVTAVQGQFGSERVIDPFVCDCCNVSLLTDFQGKLNIYYRSNINNIRDMAHRVSTDHGLSFSEPTIILADNWEINGCPHSGPTSSATALGNFVAWFSAAPTAPGIRLATEEGNRLLILDNQASNATLASNEKQAIFVWQTSDSEKGSQIRYRPIDIRSGDVQQMAKLDGIGSAPSALLLDNTLLVASETKNRDGKSTLQITPVAL
ncbi:BNR repeat protein [Dyadobacter jejuensis]|uniref:BNR repeat protein n=1 Tax=Dyadobacter jejuensis TaxID=1082580 RepID=A0A316APD5_9BACT|nr:sialidase family protein [Dyadobacter jejuensis]PWJ58670.1 BNR repeat protein [Dyadobacter jejuensis]